MNKFIPNYIKFISFCYLHVLNLAKILVEIIWIEIKKSPNYDIEDRIDSKIE